ncbi:MAG: hypothetical protein FJW34_15880 [Acidobacteria bacterium]|nr:hypothetical protein [Acidobacteriota bacterium]
MTTPKENPKRWYIVMVFCMALSFFAFVVGPRIGYAEPAMQASGILIGLWAPVLGIMGLRAELLGRKPE